MPGERKQAALAFARWFLTFDAQKAYAEAGSIPVRSDVYEALAGQEEFRWMKAYLDSMPYARQIQGYAEGSQVDEILGLRLNQALIGEMSVDEALDAAAEEIYQVFKENDRKHCPADRRRFSRQCRQKPRRKKPAAAAEEGPVEVGPQEPITILINDSPLVSAASNQS